jgi:hypothetical protein
MVYVRIKVLNSAGVPVAGAEATIVDVFRTPTKRNGVFIQRSTDDEGNLLIPALSTDYVQIKHATEGSVTISAEHQGSIVRLSNTPIFIPASFGAIRTKFYWSDIWNLTYIAIAAILIIGAVNYYQKNKG